MTDRQVNKPNSHLFRLVTRLLHTSKAASTAVLLLILVAFLLRAVSLDAQSLWRDEVDVIRFATESPAELTKGLLREGHNGPFYYVVMHVWLFLVGSSEFGLRFLSLACSVLAVALLWRVGERMIGARAAMLAALIAAVSPYLVWYGQDAKMYAMVSALSLAAVLCLWRALSGEGTKYWVGFVLAASFSLYIHLLSALMIAVFAAALPIFWPSFRQRWRGWLLSLALLTLPYLPLAAWQMPLLLRTFDTGHPQYGLRQMLSLLLSLYTRGVTQIGCWVLSAAFLFALLVGIFGPRESRGWPVRRRIFLAAWFLLPVVLIYLVSLRVPVFEPRYLIFIAPAFYLLTALGLQRLWRLSPYLAGVPLALILSFSLLGVTLQATRSLKSDFRSAAAYVFAHRQDGEPILFQMPYIQHTFDYYFGESYTSLEGPWTNGGQDVGHVQAALTDMLEEYPAVWLVQSESALWDERDLTQGWLQAHGQMQDEASFALVDVRRYELGK
jgi:mannosyltransferase